MTMFRRCSCGVSYVTGPNPPKQCPACGLASTDENDANRPEGGVGAPGSAGKMVNKDATKERR